MEMGGVLGQKNGQRNDKKNADQEMITDHKEPKWRRRGEVVKERGIIRMSFTLKTFK